VTQRDAADIAEPEIVATQLARIASQVVSLLRAARSGAGVGGPSPGPGAGEGPAQEPGLAAIRLARELRSLADGALQVTVERAREAGRTWQEIGDALDTTRQAAFQRFGRPIDPRTGEPMSKAVLPGAAERAIAIFSDWTEGRFEAVVAANFDEIMTRELPVEKIAAASAQVTGLVGAYQGMGEPFVRQLGDYTVVDIPMEFEASEMKGRVAFNADGQVSGLFILNPDVP
jgi:Protein of unknown function (DUF3887)